jgi:phosphomannomutase
MKSENAMDKIFQSYDVRGIYPEEYNGDVAYRLGRAATDFTGARRILLGRDMRRGGHALLSALAMGAMDQGADVTDAGMCTSDALYFAAYKGKFDLAVMVTASHNPAAFNGTKLVRLDGTSIGSKTGLLDIKKAVLSGDFPETRRKGSIHRTGTVMRQFVRHALGFVDRRKLKPMKIVVDAGNGMGGVLMNLVRERVPFEIVPMYFEPDGSFPNHDADPTRPECVEILRRRVRKEKADLGIGFDGDADRVALVDETGGLINGSELGSVICPKILSKYPGAKVGYCLVSSWIKRDTILENDGEPVITPVGGAHIRPVMKEQDVVFVSERSGHFYLKDNNYADSGLIAALIALERLSAEACKLSELMEPYRRYHMAPEFSLLLGTEDSTAAELRRIKKEKMEKIKELAKGARVVKAGEERYEFDDWWFCVRPSGTEPRKLRMTVEATSRKRMQKKYDQIKALLTS